MRARVRSHPTAPLALDLALGLVGRVRCEVRSRAGIITSRYEGPCNSYTVGMLKALAVMLFDAGTTQSFTTTTGGSTSAANCFFNSTVDGRGVVVGTSSTADVFGDTALGARIVGGTGAGQMVVGAQTVTESVSAGVVTVSIARAFTNNSGSSITVREVGIYANSTSTATSTTNLWMILRDVVADQVVANGSTLTVHIDLAANAGAGSLINSNGANMWVKMGTTARNMVDIAGATDVAVSGQMFANPQTATLINGLRVGTGTTPHSKDAATTFKLGTPIADGAGAGQMLHSASTLDAVSVGGASGSVVIRRSFVNNSGSTITVQEAGLYGSTQQSAPSSTNTYLFGGRVLAAPVAVAHGTGIEVTFTLTLTH